MGGQATEFTELARALFPDSPTEHAERATDILLTLPPLLEQAGGRQAKDGC